MSGHGWRGETKTAREWAQEIVSGELMRKIEDEGLGASDKFDTGSGKHALHALVFAVSMLAPEERTEAARAKAKEAGGRFALEAIRAASWEEAVGLDALGWLLAAAFNGQGKAALELLRPIFSEERLAEAFEASLEADREARISLKKIEILKETRIPEIWGRSQTARARVSKALLSKNQWRWQEAAEFLRASEDLAKWLGSPNISGETAIGGLLEKGLGTSGQGASMKGLETCLEAAISQRSGAERSAWARSAGELIESLAPIRNWRDEEASLALLEAAVIDGDLSAEGKAAGARRAL